MAIIIDPDQLDRNQVIFNTESQKVSLYPVGSLISAQSGDGGTHSGTSVFYDMNADFVASGINTGDILSIYTGASAGHYIIESGITAHDFTVVVPSGLFIDEASLVYDVREPVGGSIADGVSEQCVYSFAKEEWRSDSTVYGGDDLIRHPFPFEPITSEQFEIGGGSSHDNWTWFNTYTRKKIRNGGWSEVDSNSQAQYKYSGFRSLGSMDSDAQPYYQQNNAVQPPVNFTFTGAVNEAVNIWDNQAFDYTTYFKAFLRKKGKTYASYNLLTEQNLTELEYKLYSFPLTHAVDAAIVATDNEIEGINPWARYNLDEADRVGYGSNGVTTSSSGTFTASGEDFLSTVVEGDVLNITGSGNDAGKYIVISVDSDTQLTVDVSEEFSGSGFNGNSSLSYNIYSRYIVADKSSGDGSVLPITDGVLANVDGSTGTLASTSSNFTTSGVAVDDLVWIVESESDHRGLYKVISIDDANTLTVDTEDKTFTAKNDIDFYVVHPGMYLQYKAENISLSSPGNLTFANDNPDTITRNSGSWTADGVLAGDVITITGSANNDGSYTVATPGTSTLTLIATDSLVAEGPSAATATITRGFTRTIGSVAYSFNWKLLGNEASAADCYQYIQHQLRQTTDIDNGPGSSRGDITDALMSYATPTGTTTNMIIDNISNVDLNNVTFEDATGEDRSYPYVAAGTITFNDNLKNDASAKYWMFFTNDDVGDDLGRDYGTKDAIIVQDSNDTNIAGTVNGESSIAFTYDYDNNIQRGAASAGQDAPITIVAIGLDTAQFVLATGTISRSKSNNFSLVSALERNYSNPS